MADEKQLTVAELLARNRQGSGTAEPAGSDTPPKRRRRRSIEDGGVTVAELTGSFKAVKATPTESRHSSVPLDEPAAPVKSAPVKSAPVKSAPVPEKPVQEKPVKSAPSNDDTGVIEKVSEEPKAARAVPAAAGTSTATGSSTATSDATETGVLPRVRAEEPVPEAQPAPVPAHEDHEAEYADEPDNGGSGVGAAVALAVVGIIVGAVIFLLFQALWARLDVWLVAVLAVAVTAALIAVTHRLRTASDGLSMTLAGLVGLVVTFGPAVLVLF